MNRKEIIEAYFGKTIDEILGTMPDHFSGRWILEEWLEGSDTDTAYGMALRVKEWTGLPMVKRYTIWSFGMPNGKALKAIDYREEGWDPEEREAASECAAEMIGLGSCTDAHIEPDFDTTATKGNER